MEVGQTYPTLSGEEVRVVEYLCCVKVKVMFINSGYETFATAGSIRKGYVKNVLYKSLHGTGLLGVGGFSRTTAPEAYSHWSHMIGRCYSNSGGITYKGCTVVEDWHNFQNFAKWFVENKKSYKGALDKDIIKKGNKIYCPDLCEIVPQGLNNFLCKADAIRGELPIGVVKSNRNGIVKYIAQVYYKGKHQGLGAYSNVGLAFNAYKTRKEAIAKELAIEYYEEGYITKRAYEALYNYEVNIND